MNSFVYRAKAQLGQVSWAFREFRTHTSVANQRRAIRNMSVPRIPKAKSGREEVWGISVVRDEMDVLPSVVEHMFEQGLDRLLIADNRSKDGTREWLQQRAAVDDRLIVALDEEPSHIQSAKMTWLAHQAWRAGAAWIVNFDADEFWFAEGDTVAGFLRGRDATVAHATFLHMVPTEPDPAALRDAEFVMDTAPSIPGKVAIRTHGLAIIGAGNHYAVRVGKPINGLRIAHAQYRGPSQVARKVRQGTEAARQTGEDLSWFSPHWQSGAAMSDEEIIDAFARISRGEPEPRLGYKAVGPMERVRPLRWKSWNEDKTLPELSSLTSIGAPSGDRSGQGFAVIIPTLQKSAKLWPLVDICIEHPLVSEIVIINNAAGPLDWKSPKVTVLQQDGNIFVNPAWNLGVQQTDAAWLAILNDDILFSPDLFDHVARLMRKPYVGVLGVDPSCLTEEVSDRGFWAGPNYRRVDPFGVAMFMRRERYVPIPEDMKIWYGDDWLYTRQKRRNFVFGGLKIDTVVGTTSHRPEFLKITDADREAYERHGAGDYAERFRQEDRVVHSLIRVKQSLRRWQSSVLSR